RSSVRREGRSELAEPHALDCALRFGQTVGAAARRILYLHGIGARAGEHAVDQTVERDALHRSGPGDFQAAASRDRDRARIALAESAAVLLDAADDVVQRLARD